MLLEHKNMSNKYIYIVGGLTYFDYINWILPLGFSITKNIEESNLLMFAGGEDISSYLYNDPQGSYTGNNKRRDEHELNIYKEAKRLNIPCVGICRGGQFLTAMNGGKICQHSSHPSSHNIKTFDGLTLEVSSSHHQQFVVDQSVTGLIEGVNYKLIGWAENLSPYHLNGEDKDFNFGVDYKEPEIIFFNKTKDFCCQSHPEWQPVTHKTVKYVQSLVEKLLLE